MAYITLKNPNEHWHGKHRKADMFYFRFHYGKQRIVFLSKVYTDHPTEAQKASREAFTELRREVARQLHDPILRARWQAHFKKDNAGYKMLHTYVYAQLKAGENVSQSLTCRDAIYCVSPSRLSSPRKLSTPQSPSNTHYTIFLASRGKFKGFMLYNGQILPLFLPSKVPKRHAG